MNTEHVKSYSLEVDDSSATAVALLAAHTGLSKAQIKQAMEKGAVWIQRCARTQHTVKIKDAESLTTTKQTKTISNRVVRLRRAKGALSVGDRLSFYYNPEVLANRCEVPRLIADLKTYSIWDKPSGVLCQGSKWGDHTTLARLVVKNHFPDRECIVVHRLDRMASGLIILAHNKKTAAVFTQMFAQRELTKTYSVIVKGELLESLPYKIDQAIEGRSAVTVIHQSRLAKQLLNKPKNVGAVESLDNCIELLVTIESGRKHQIRRHLAGIHLPIVGDRLYGAAVCENQKTALLDLQLRSVKLSFKDPMGNDFQEWQV